MKLLRLFLCAMALLVFAPVVASAETYSKFNQPSVQASPASTTTSPDVVPLAPLGLSLVGIALMGATKKVTLPRTYLFDNQTYGPGTDIEVPEEFPDIDDNGDVIFEEGSAAAKNAARARTFSSPPNTGGVKTGEEAAPAGPNDATVRTVSGKTKAQLESMKVDELDALAVEVGVPVERGDGQEGDPLKADYVKALSATV